MDKLKNSTILVVDDEADLRNMLTHLLKQAGFQVVTAENGQEAVEAVEKEIPALILMDLMMPIMNGIEATKQIRRYAGEQLPIVAITAYDLRRLVLPEEELRMWQAVLKKPIPIDMLRSVVADLLNEDNQQASI
jgi:CheY-like chemotaxis protein